MGPKVILNSTESRALAVVRTASGVYRMTIKQVPRKEVRRALSVQVWNSISCGARKREHNRRHERIGAREASRKRLEPWSRLAQVIQRSAYRG
jgi:hypothetical protein